MTNFDPHSHRKQHVQAQKGLDTPPTLWYKGGTMRRDWYNILPAGAAVAAYLCALLRPECAAQAVLWVVPLSCAGLAINLCLFTARILTRRNGLTSAMWGTVHLLLASCAWAVWPTEQEPALAARLEACRRGADAFERGETGSLITLAAMSGRVDLLREFLPALPTDEAQRSEAALALLRAAECGRTSAIEYLVKHIGLRPDATTDGSTPLHEAVRNNRHRAVRLLLQQGADINRPAGDGQTPLMTAALAGDVSMVKLLLKHGADPAARTPEGETAEDFTTSEEISTLLKHP